MRCRARQSHDAAGDICFLNNPRHVTGSLAGIAGKAYFQIRARAKVTGQTGSVLKALACALGQMWWHAVRGIAGKNHTPAPPTSGCGGNGKRPAGPFNLVIGKNSQR